MTTGSAEFHAPTPERPDHQGNRQLPGLRATQPDRQRRNRTRHLPGTNRQKHSPNRQNRRIPTVMSTKHEHPQRMLARSPLRALRQDERGAGTAELVIATPVLLLLILLIVQFALYMHATHIAQAAASEALSAARVYGGSAAAGNAQAQHVLAQLGSGPLQGSSVQTQRGTNQTSVTITGTVSSVLPFVTLTVHAEAVGPVEKFTVPAGGGAAP